MYGVRLVFGDGEVIDDDSRFATEEKANDYGQYVSSCYAQGTETLHLSNPGEYSGEVDDHEIEVYEVEA